MSDDMFDKIRKMSLEIHALIRQGVRVGVEERIVKRNLLLQEWFAGITKMIDVTNDQQIFFENLLKEERQLLDNMKTEQRSYRSHQKGVKQLSKYNQVSHHKH